MEKKNILVFPCGSEIGLDIYHSVKYSTHFHLIGASSVEDHGAYTYDDYIGNVPFTDDVSFISFMAELVEERKVDAIYPTMDSVISVLKSNETELGCKVIASPVNTTQIAMSKKKTYDILRNYLNIPKCYNIDDDITFPVFIKPDVGYGARGTKLVHNRDELRSSLYNAEKNMLILEYLPGEEYTVDCFTTRCGELKFAAARVRNRIKSGISVNTSYVKQQGEFVKLAKIINSVIDFRGAWFFQVKRNQNSELCLLEVASRFGGSSILSKAIGVNFPLLTLFDAFEYEVEIVRNEYAVTLDRALSNKYKTNLIYDSVYVDYDDCLILNRNVVNDELVRYLYRCINSKKKIILLTKHQGDLKKDMQQYRLTGLFDEIIHITHDEKKYKHIKHANPIFIDDSHAERFEVKSNLNIPVFSPEMIEILM